MLIVNWNSLLKLAKKERKKAFVLGILISLALFTGLLYTFKSFFFVALVNNRPISRLAFNQELTKQYGNTVLENLILKSLILQEGKKRKIEITNPQIAEKIKAFVQEIESQGSNFENFLASQGRTRKELEEQVKIQLMIEEIFREKIQIGDEEIAAYFKTNQSFFPKEATLESQKEEIKETLRQQKLADEFNSWVENLRSEAKILYFLKF